MLDKKSLKSGACALIALSASVLTFAPLCVHADSPFAPSTVQVKFSDLNPNTAEGAHRLYARIATAAYAACGESASDMAQMMSAPGPCVRDAIGRAVRSAKIPNLAKVFVDKNGANVALQFGIEQEVRTAKN